MENSNVTANGAKAQSAEQDGRDNQGCPTAQTCCGTEIRDCLRITDKKPSVKGENSQTKEVKKMSMCAKCPMRARYDKNPKSLIGRIWRWHIGFCPGWKLYMKGLSDEERARIAEKYNLK